MGQGPALVEQAVDQLCALKQVPVGRALIATGEGTRLHLAPSRGCWRGQLPPASLGESSESGVPLQFGWGEILKALGDQVKAIQPDMTDVRAVLEPSARKRLLHVYADHEMNALLDDTWARYSDLIPSIPAQETVGARFMVHLSAITIAICQALVAAGQTKADATRLIYDIKSG